MMNKEKNRVRIDHDISPSVLSGHLDYTNSFKPLIYKGTFVDKCKAFLGDCTMVEVTMGNIWEDFPECIHGKYEWVLNKVTGMVTKVYNPSTKENSTNVDCSAPFHYQNGNYVTFYFYRGE